MAIMETPQVNIGWQAKDFSLLGADGKIYSLEEVKGDNGLLVMFISNHCPFVKAILDKIIRDTHELKHYGIGSVAIMSNDVINYPEDSFENMQKLTIEKNLPFPYLFDETQKVARNYDAVCTPDFFGFNKELKLEYRGRLDAARRENIQGIERELFNAMVEIARTGKGPKEQHPSMGCSIKWK